MSARQPHCQAFRLVRELEPVLLALEPDDIHIFKLL